MVAPEGRCVQRLRTASGGVANLSARRNQQPHHLHRTDAGRVRERGASASAACGDVAVGL